MPAVTQADSTIIAMRKKIRRLTASASESSLSTAEIDQYINTFYNNDFPYGIKIDQMRSVYTFFTEPYRDRYPLDVNYNQGVRAPFYVDGIEGTFLKDRGQFYNIWPRFPTLFHPISGDSITTSFSFTIPGPFLSREVTLGGVDTNGVPITVNDDGNGNLLQIIPNPQTYNPPIFTSPSSSQIPGMHNANTGNPGLNNVTLIGTVDYVTGNFVISNFLVAPAAGTQMTLWVSQYQTGRPYSLLFWNNEFQIRPVPKLIHKLEIETFLTPVQFMTINDTPILNQWWQYIAIGAAIKVLEDRQDMDGLANLSVLFDNQEALILERQSIEEIGQANIQFFNSTQCNYINGGYGQGGGY